jgi:regulatory protein
VPSSNPTSPPTDAVLRARALRLLGRREYARRELGERLTRWGASSDQTTRLLDGLEADGLLSEVRYAESWTRAHLARGDGPRRLRQGLAHAGVDASLIDATLSADEDWAGRLEAARRRRFGTAPPADWPAWARQARYLERRGYAPELIRRQLPRPRGGSAPIDAGLD